MAYLIHLAIMASIFAILAVGLNLVVGHTGLLSVAHAAFFGIGAYTVAILMVFHHLPFSVALIAAILVTAFVTFVFGLILSTLRGDYYALGSLGLNSVVYAAMLNLDSITRGPLGIPGIPRPMLFGWSFASGSAFLLLSLLLLLFSILVAFICMRTPFGRVLKAIREDEDALQIFGYRARHFKLTVFVLASVLAAVAGALYATYIGFVDPSAFIVFESVNLLTMIILGGLATLRGSVIGATFFIVLYEAVRFLGFSPSIAGHMRVAVVGLLLILLMIFRPQGLFGEYKL